MPTPSATRLAPNPMQQFGRPAESKNSALEIRWPDRTVSMIDGRTLEPNRWLTITRRAADPAPSATSLPGSTQPTDALNAHALNGPTD